MKYTLILLLITSFANAQHPMYSMHKDSVRRVQDTNYHPPPMRTNCFDYSKDSTWEWMILRKKQLNDSIALIDKQNRFLDSLSYTCDTVKWVPYYYRPKKKKK